MLKGPKGGGGWSMSQKVCCPGFKLRDETNRQQQEAFEGSGSGSGSVASADYRALPWKQRDGKDGGNEEVELLFLGCPSSRLWILSVLPTTSDLP